MNMFSWEILYQAIPFLLLGVGALLWVGLSSDKEYEKRPESKDYD